MLNWKVKSFNQLEINELYELLQLRVEIFVVEQNCPYQELDGMDRLAYHLLGYENGELKAYSRLFKGGILFEDASIGRVIVRKESRHLGYGQALINKSISYMESQWQEQTILIHAQEYLKDFYQSFGFQPVSDVYLLDGINHINMVRKTT
ncbi:GNAT family N-acetyltransferase [Halalkalibacter akibai]|uniref:ElaA protein n=1 Tax=Halalkalibacter akibai (strain ATCC 43226 / DSM 21942 / CIP 109018 / JCM 9157 / 1139) TaxID=1236973 RepID=W4R093_HALA3|nr:ElaA protein [Halalkalibacter akibai JCM 9157]